MDHEASASYCPEGGPFNVIPPTESGDSKEEVGEVSQ